jgi:hypothetical protein
MNLLLKLLFYLFIFSGAVIELYAQSGNRFKIFQFPPDQIPRIDGNTDDWIMVPGDYCFGTEYLVDDERIHAQPDSGNLNVKVRVGWVKGMNRLYFLYEAYDNYWDFSRTDLHHDIFEVVVDGDRSGGPFIEQFHPKRDSLDKWDLFFSFHGVHAQNYHIYTPAEGQDWCMAWGSQTWIKKLPYANSAYSYNFNPGDPGKLVMEFWITPFDSAYYEGPSLSLESSLTENKEIGLSWAIIDWDDVNAESNNGFWNLSDKHTMYGNASYLRAFRLMPLEEKFQNKLKAEWSFRVVDVSKRLVAFQDHSEGKITSWKWDFGDGTLSEEQHPIHSYEQAGLYIVTLYVEGSVGQSRMAKVWDVAVR